MHKRTGWFAILALTAIALIACAIWPTLARAHDAAYASMAPLNEYLMPRKAEIELARSAAPASISDGASVMVLGRKGYTTAAKGNNGFLCLVERSWGAPIADRGFWNPDIRGPICFNPQAARSFAPVYLLKTRLVLAGKSRQEVARALSSAFNDGELPALAPGAMSYMLSRQQRIGDHAMTWHPHLMFYVAGDAAKSWGGNFPGSPVMAQDAPEEHVTILMVLVGRWADGTAASRVGQ